MADSGRPASKPAGASRDVSKGKTVRSQKIFPDSPKDGVNKAAKPVAADESQDNEPLPLPLPRTQTPGRLTNKGAKDRQRKLSDLSIRQRSQSVSHVSPVSRPPTSGAATTPKPLPTSTSAVAGPRADGDKDNDNKEQKPQAVRRLAASTSNRGTLSTSNTARQVSARPTRPPRGQHIPFPPLHRAEDAPDVEPAPPSGMYWSKAVVCGSPHPNLRAHTATLVGSNVYVFGGWDSRTCFNNLFVLDADAFYWSVPHVAGDMPTPLRAMTCTAVGKKLVVFGGGDGPTYYNNVYVLDTLNFRWSKPRIVGDRMPCPRRAHTACLYKNGIYVFGGGDGDKALNDIWRLDVGDATKMSWKLISSSDKTPPGTRDIRPKPRGYHTGNMSGSKLIIYGGSDGAECFDDVWIYDVETHVWKAVNIATSFRRLSHTATLVGSYLFVVGGHDGDEYCNDLLLLNLVTMTWDKRKAYGKPPSGRGYHGTVLYDSRLLMIGGFDGTEVFGDVMVLELAVHAYYSQISHFSIDV
ncbi:hypothetical protein HIM_09118 [Hirsutella minnesotensis 3608]|uniref:Tip elongation aberrant protein 1 n=1 Tax=Hirsutella minnesotensis 3608 TaxID=1043627 RepID=A0A0F8A3A3_9HYPO|nr:hypothetical protein HIM_09118 [Hirsutella minnesotensis 3608]